jgi:CheY-like chemotaxis protein
LYGVVRELVKSAINIMTVEDPIEYELEGVTQIQVENKRAVTFASALRAVLRQDPDVIYVGEIRDLETAETAVHAAMTGHLVLASLHTNDAVSVAQRLVDIGLHPTSVAGSLRGVVGQRLLRRVCDACKQTDVDPLTASEIELSAVYGARPTVRAVGCKRCGMSGYRGRMAVAEVLMTSPAMADAIAKNLPVHDLQRQAVADGMRSMRDVALEAMRAGVTTLEEVERVIGEASAPAALASDTPHVLIVDDDAITRKLARTFLEKIGLRVTEVDDGRAALSMVDGSSDVALVVLDMQMPEVDGLQVLRQIRSNGATVGLPVLVLTGSEEHADEAAIMDSGADDYIRKPIDRARFTARVKAALRRAAG